MTCDSDGNPEGADATREVTHWISANADHTGNVTACGKEQVYPMRGNGWRVRDITCPDCDRVICDIVHAALKASPTTEPNPEGMQVAERGVFVRGDDVLKPKGYPFPGTVVAAFDTLVGESRFVVESKLAPGMLHIFSAKQIIRDLSTLTSAPTPFLTIEEE